MADVNDPIDLALDVNGDLVIPMQRTTGVAAVAQKLELAVSLFRGEWFLDLNQGVPYYQDILGQKFDQGAILDAFRAAILSVEDVQEILSLTATFDGTTRTTTVAWEVLTPFGSTPPQTLEI